MSHDLTPSVFARAVHATVLAMLLACCAALVGCSGESTIPTTAALTTAPTTSLPTIESRPVTSTTAGTAARPTDTSTTPASTEPDAAMLARRKVVTEFFYWYDPATGGHIDRDADDVLSLGPPEGRMPDWRDVGWFKGEFSDMMAAGIDIAACSYWQGEKFSTAGTVNAVKALDELQAEGEVPPGLAMFYETLPFEGEDLTTGAGKQAFYKNIKAFFDLVPERHRGLIEERPVVWLYNAFPAMRYDSSTFAYLRERFRADFGADPYIVVDRTWLDSGALPVDGSYTWGVAYLGFVPGDTVAGAGPGYDDHLLPSRAPGLIVPRADGACYERNLYYALASGRDVLWLETWNEHHESTNINATAEYGREYIEITRRYVDMFKHGEVPPKPALGPLSRVTSVSLEAPDDGATGEPSGQVGGLALLFAGSSEGDGLWRATEAAGRPAWKTDSSEAGRYLYFDLAEDFAWFDTPVTVDVTVEYLDTFSTAEAGAGDPGKPPVLEIQYDSFEPEREMVLADHYRPAKLAILQGSGQWKTATVRLNDVRFANGENGGADFRIWAGENLDLIVGRVAVAKVAPASLLLGENDAPGPVTLTVVYDNHLLQPQAQASLQTGWGFACLIQTEDTTVLFDTGRDGDALLDNLTALGIDLASIDAVIVSHDHSDHTGGLAQLLRRTGPVTVYYPASCSEALAHAIRDSGATPVAVGDATTLGPGLLLTGEMGGDIKEQALVVTTAEGPLLVTGCAHPGLVDLVEAAGRQAGEPIRIVLGGFHLSARSAGYTRSLVGRLEELGVTECAPAHCTGERATEILREEFGAGFVSIGVGAILTFE